MAFSAATSSNSSATSSGHPFTATRWWHTVPETGRIVCNLCPRACSLKPGDKGFCFVRENQGGQMVLSTYGRSTGFCIDPIEKKPLNHFYPGTSVLSFGTAGCNLGCKFCQNWDISKSRAVERLSEQATPEAIAAAARELGCRSVAFTYNDPVIWAEYAIDTARACREQGVKTVAVTAGYITPEARGPFYEHMDAANVDLKAFTEDFYWHTTQSHLQPVLDTLVWLKHESDVWFEITNLIIPRANDDPEEIRQMCGWVLENLGDEVPLHFTAFHPDFRMLDRPGTPPETLVMAYDIARKAGLKYIYVGNVHDRSRSSTYCPGCGEVFIDRDWHQLHAYRMRENRCARCETAIAGRWDTAPGNWGARRLPVDMSRYAHVSPGAERGGQAHFAPKAPQNEPVPVGKNLAENNEPFTPGPSPARGEGSNRMATKETAGGLSLLAEQKNAIHRAASQFVYAKVHQRPHEHIARQLGALAQLPLWGAFVTLKRRGRLRGCCGQMGGLPLGEAICTAAGRTADDDLRFPAVSPTELAFLDLDVSLLHSFQPVTAPAVERARAIEPGRHGLVLRRGSASGLFLPQVASEHGWDAERFLRELCVKAGLPTTAWKQPDTQLFSFEGLAIEGPFELDACEKNDGGDGTRSVPATLGDGTGTVPATFDTAAVGALAEHCRRNLLASVRGATASYYLPGGPEGRVHGIVLSLEGPAHEEVAMASHIDLLKSSPLQSTAHALVEGIGNSLRGRGYSAEQMESCRVRLLLLNDPAMHGTVGELDLRGIDPHSRAVLVFQSGSMSWSFDPDAKPDELVSTAVQLLGARDPEHALIFSVSAMGDGRAQHGAAKPRADHGAAIRPAAVAGAFYPAEPEVLAKMIDDLLADARQPAETCSAVIVPHAGYRYSGRLAAMTFAAAEIPETVIIIGPKHTALGVDWAVAPHEAWQIPGGMVRSDPDLARRLVAAIPGLELDAAAHRQEHAIEVELPLLARLAPEAKVVGIVMGSGNLERCRTMARGLAGVIRELPKPPLLVVSTDMNHFAPDVETRELDALALAELERLDTAGLLRVVRQHHISMCGVLPAVVVLETLKELNLLGSCRRIGYATSADASGDTSRVVGYAGMTIRA